MSTATKSLLGDYSQAVSQFQAASQGSYGGPSTPLDLLGSMIGSVDGIKPQELVQGTIAAMGGKRPARGGGGLKGFLVGVVLSIAGDALLEHLGSVSSYLCVGLFLQVFVEAVGVGHSHLVDGLFPAGNPGSFDES
ncbi:hypothetical protein ACL1BN_12285, partial [Corynebacterium striatum]